MRGSRNPPAPTKKTSVEITLVFCFIRHPEFHLQGWIRTAAEPTAACGGNREARLGQRSAFSKPCQGAAEKAASATRKTRRTVRQTTDKRKSAGPCRWVIAFLVPCGTGRVNDKKVNEENSKVKTKACAEPNLLLQSEDVSKFRFCWIQHTTFQIKLQALF